MSLIFSLRKFHQYLYARNFTILTDHKPLLAILGPKKNIPTLAAAQMQRWALLLSAYTYKLEYQSTRAHGNADGLSRLPIPQEKFSQHSESTIYNVCQVEYLPVTFMQLQRATRCDPVLCKVLNCTKSGWPSHFTSANKVIPEELKPFWSRRHELTTECDCLL